ncbi:MAG: PfkB family carbohydrate kinase [Vicinamibacteria bacterium]
MGFDVIAFGEALLRLQPEGDRRIEESPGFTAYPGGAELNTCYALANLGLRTAWFSVLPEGPLGRRILRHLRGAGVDVSLVKTRPGRLGTYWVEYGREPRSIEVLYDRKDSTICGVRAEDVPWEAIRAARVFFVSGITPALSPASRTLAIEMARAARDAGVMVATDLNYRSRLWSPEQAAPVLEELARSADVLIATEDDLNTLYGMTGTSEAVARTAQQRFGARTVVLTRGSEGGLCLESGEVRATAVFRSARIDRVGAGDAFTAGFLWATLTGRQARALDYGLALAGLKHSLPGDTLITTPEEVERIMDRQIRDIQR